MIFGYARVSTENKILDMQIDVLTRSGVEKIYKEKLTGLEKIDLNSRSCLKF